MSSSASEVVSTTTGIMPSWGSSLSSASTSRPSRRGRFRSSRIRPGRGASAYSPSWRRNCSACSPSLTTWRRLRILWYSNASLVIRTSPSSSSTSSTSTTSSGVGSAIGVVLLFRCRRDDREREAEARSAAVLGVEPDAPAVVLDDLAAHREADPGARVLALAVQPLEDHEDALGVVRLDADPVVEERDLPELAVPVSLDHDVRRVVAAELEGV